MKKEKTLATINISFIIKSEEVEGWDAFFKIIKKQAKEMFPDSKLNSAFVATEKQRD